MERLTHKEWGLLAAVTGAAALLATLSPIAELALLPLGVVAVWTISRVRSGGESIRKTVEQLRQEIQRDHARFERGMGRILDLTRAERFDNLLRQCRIRELPLTAIFPGIERVVVPIGAINEETGHANQAELLYLCALAAYRRVRRIFEFGTYFGRTTYHLSLASPEAEVVTLDLPPDGNARPGEHTGAYFKGTERAGRIRQLLCDSRQLDTTSYRGKMDFIWVDADHSYELVKNDTAKAFEMLAPGGMILWHDFAAKTPGVVEFFREFTQARPVFRIQNTSILLHMDGIDPLAFVPHPVRVCKAMIADFERWSNAASRPAA